MLQVMEDEDVPARAAAAGARLARALAALAGVKEVRGLGLLVGAELESADAREVAAAALAAGLVVNPVSEHALRLAPSLLVADDEVDAAVAILAKVLGA